MSSCELSSTGRAFSTVLFAFIGSIINGLSSGAFVAFMTGWIAWLAVTRVIVSALWEFKLAFQTGTDFSAAEDATQYEHLPVNAAGSRPTKGPSTRQDEVGIPLTRYGGGPSDNHNTAYEPYSHPQQSHYNSQPPTYWSSQIESGWNNSSNSNNTYFNNHYNNNTQPPPPQQSHWNHLQQPTHPPQHATNTPPSFNLFTKSRSSDQTIKRWDRGVVKDTTFLGWLGWLWSAIYTPISQTIWIAVSLSSPQTTSGGVKITRAIAVGVSALALAIDTKHRYAAILGRKFGRWTFLVFNLWHAFACLLLGGECMYLLISGFLSLDRVPVFVPIVYALFSCVWAWMSFKILPTVDASRKGVNILVDLLAGAFTGLFVAAPAFILWQNARFNERVGGTDGLGLGEFLQCEGGSLLEKISAVLP